MDYFQKIEEKPKDELTWNIPEKKQGIINIVGGNSQSFKNEIKIAEYLNVKFPIDVLNVVLPDTLKNQLPSFPNFKFLKSTDSGSFKDGTEIAKTFNSGDFNLALGDLSKNAITGKAFFSACKEAERPTILTRDAVDLFIENLDEAGLMNENLIFFASIAQLQKLLRAVYYPKMLLLSQSLVQVVDILHKFTLSYPISIITLHNEQILIVKNGNVKGVPIIKSGYSPFMLFQGELAAKIVALNLYNPNNFLNATISAVFNE